MEYTFIQQFMNNIDVICPRCNSRAKVSREENKEKKLICTNCGLITSAPCLNITSSYTYCSLQYPLWYTANYKGKTFYAYNIEHLMFLKKYIADTKRERAKSQCGWRNSSIQSRLPKWIKSKKNRQYLLDLISKLECK